MSNTRYAIPDKLVAYMREPEEVFQAFTKKVFPLTRATFVVDGNYPSLEKAALKWVNQPIGYRDPPGSCLWSYRAPVSEILELKNDPVTDLTVLSITHRREGGVAIKVITPQGWLVDFREEEFMEAAITGALHSGIFHGEYVWSRGGNQMRLVRVGSPTWEERSKFGNGVK